MYTPIKNKFNETFLVASEKFFYVRREEFKISHFIS